MIEINFTGGTNEERRIVASITHILLDEKLDVGSVNVDVLEDFSEIEDINYKVISKVVIKVD